MNGNWWQTFEKHPVVHIDYYEAELHHCLKGIDLQEVHTPIHE